MEGSKQSFFDRLKDATGVVMERTREGIEDLQTKQALSRAYNDLGRTTVELVEKGELTHPQLTAAVDEIKKLKAELEAEGGSDTPASEPAAAEPAADEPPPPAG
jgi:hypothetical protein